jgi:hypothetical protein
MCLTLMHSECMKFSGQLHALHRREFVCRSQQFYCLLLSPLPLHCHCFYGVLHAGVHPAGLS